MSDNKGIENKDDKATNNKISGWKVSELFKEDNGKLSATRLALLLWTTGVLVLIIVVAIKDIEHLDKLPYDSLITIMAMLMGGKVIQKYGEEKNNK